MRGVRLFLAACLSVVVNCFCRVRNSISLPKARLPLALASVLVVLAVTNAATAVQASGPRFGPGFFRPTFRPQRVVVNNFGGGFGAQSFGAFAVPGCHVNGVQSFGVQSFGFGPRVVGFDAFGRPIVTRF